MAKKQTKKPVKKAKKPVKTFFYMKEYKTLAKKKSKRHYA